jgi:transcription antitermination factor NusG
VTDGAKLYRQEAIFMSTNSINVVACTEHTAEPNASRCVRWFAAYTFANHEKKVACELQRRELQSFLPLYKSSRRWSDRRQVVTAPLFPGYVFVRLALEDRLRVLRVPGVARLVGFGGLPTPLPDEQIEPLRCGWSDGLKCEPHPYLNIGQRVRVVGGPLAGAEGILLRKKGSLRVVISVEAILRSIAVEVEAGDVESIPH